MGEPVRLCVDCKGSLCSVEGLLFDLNLIYSVLFYVKTLYLYAL